MQRQRLSVLPKRRFAVHKTGKVTSPPEMEDDEALVLTKWKRLRQAQKPLYVPAGYSGAQLVHNAVFNKGTAFDKRERDRWGIRGLIPTSSREFGLPEQLERLYIAYNRCGGTYGRDQKVYKRKENRVAKVLCRVSVCVCVTSADRISELTPNNNSNTITAQLPDGFAGSQRSALLRAAQEAHCGDAAHCVHADDCQGD
jgi:hypothetical protein